MLKARAWTSISTEEQREKLREKTISDDPLQDPLFDAILKLSNRVRSGGDSAIREITTEIDRVELGPAIVLSSRELNRRHGGVLDAEIRAAIDVSINNSRDYNRLLLHRAEFREQRACDSTEFGQVVRPVGSAAVFVPAGKGSYPSVLIQIGTPAVTAGVGRTVVITSPDQKWGSDFSYVDPAVAYVAEQLGIEEIIVGNGPSVVAAAAFGTESIQPVDMIVGPGSRPIVIAQLIAQLSGKLIQPGLGPSDSLIITDGDQDIVQLAVDLISEAEHGSDSSVMLFATSSDIAKSVAMEADRVINTLPEPRASFARDAVHNGGIFWVDNLDQAVALSNRYAPEHLLLITKDDASLVSSITAAGTVLLGPSTPFVSSSYAAGTPATLPTSGSARLTSGVTSLSYVRRISTLKLSEAGMKTLAPHIATLAKHEGFPAHEAAAQFRLRRDG